MCSPCIMAEVDRVIADRRRFLKTAAGSCAAVAGIGSASVASTNASDAVPTDRPPTTFSRTVDLTHTLTPDFPAWFSEGQDIMGRTAPASLTEVDEFVIDAETPFALKKVSYWEHVGTHVDAANHCSAGGKSVDERKRTEPCARWGKVVGHWARECAETHDVNGKALPAKSSSPRPKWPSRSA